MSELYHYGTKGQKWGVRKYQNEDGTLTAEGRKRYLDGGYGTGEKKRLLKSNYRDYKYYNKKYDKLTAKMEAKKAAGKKISGFSKKRAMAYGINANSAGIYSRNLDKWLDREGRANTSSKLAQAPFLAANVGIYGKQMHNMATGGDGSYGLLAAQVATMATQFIAGNEAYKISQMNQGDYKQYKEWGESVTDKAKDLTMSDLKKRGLI